MTGTRYEDLTVLRFLRRIVYPSGSRHYMWLCRCDCGNTCEVSAANLKTGNTTSCGCRQSRERAAQVRRKYVGRTYDRLTVLAVQGHGDRSRWVCRCECGNVVTVHPSNVTSRKTQSCGCLSRERATTHGRSQTDVYKIWAGIKGRCTNPDNPSFHNYGDRGVTMQPEWVESFEAFIAHLGPRPSPKHTVERVSNDLGYVEGNVRWATRAEQNRNKRNNRRFSIAGETLVLTDWAARYGISLKTLDTRLRLGWPIELALAAPPHYRKHGAQMPPRLKLQKRAHAAVAKAVREGRLTKFPACEYPGCTDARVQAHHHKGYDPEHWLDVLWLCPSHHGQAE